MFRARWHGLAHRQLSSLDPWQAFTMLEHRVAHQDSFTVQGTFEPAQIADNLPEIVCSLLTPLYEQFQFFKLSIDLVSQSLPK